MLAHATPAASSAAKLERTLFRMQQLQVYFEKVAGGTEFSITQGAALVLSAS
jgi:hypothetical protein